MFFITAQFLCHDRSLVFSQSTQLTNNKMPRYRREYRAIAAVNFGATGIIAVADINKFRPMNGWNGRTGSQRFDRL